MAENFHRIFRKLMIMDIIAGICIPGLPDKYKSLNIVFLLYCMLAQLICAGQIVGCILVLSDYMHNTNFVHTASILSLLVSTLFWSFYFLYKRGDFISIVRRLSDLIEVFNNDPLIGRDQFENSIIKEVKIIDRVTVTLFISMCCLPIVNNTQKLIRSWRFFGLDGLKKFNYQVPYNAMSSPTYEVTILMQATSLFWTCTEQGCTIYLFVTFYFLISNFFKHLQKSMKFALPPDEISRNLKNLDSSALLESEGDSQIRDVSSEEDPTGSLRFSRIKYLKVWIKMHQNVLDVSRDIIKLYSPILSVYFAYIYITVAFTVFSAMQNTHSHTFVEVIVLAYFTLLTLVNFYILCSYGNLIMIESENVLWSTYASPWYESTKEHKTMLKAVLQRAAKPVVVNCFSSTAFDLSNATFIVIMKSIVSFYLGLVQMRKE